MSAKNILVIDDDKNFVAIVRESLDPALYNVQAAGDGETGLELMKTFVPNLILLDIQMPRMGGIEFLTQLKKTYGDKAVPVIITTNDSSLETISESVQLGVRSYIVKSNESLEGIKKAVELLREFIH